jgi:nucleoside-diphosphate-sugar epimerase
MPVKESVKNVEWIEGDILDIPSLEIALEGIQHVYHCAAIVSFIPRQRKLLYKVNIEGTANVVNACLNAGVKKLLHVSSVSALGRMRENETVNESMQWSEKTNNSEYGKTKYLAEMEVWRGIGEGLEAVMVNPSIILGASDWNKGSSALFKNAYNEFPWYTEGVTGFVDVKDVVNAMIQLMESEVYGQRFIINATNITYRELFTLIASSFGKKPPHKKVTRLIGEMVWRGEAVKSLFNGKQPFITKETARTAQAKVFFDNNKLLEYIPSFQYTPLALTVQQICEDLKKMYNLS